MKIFLYIRDIVFTQNDSISWKVAGRALYKRLHLVHAALIGIALLVVVGCTDASNATTQISKPAPDSPSAPVPGPSLFVRVQISTGTVMQGGDVTLSATVQNVGDTGSDKNAILVFYSSNDPIITPDFIESGLFQNLTPTVWARIQEGLDSDLGLDPAFTASVLEQLADNQNANTNIDQGVIIAGAGLDPIIDSRIVGPLGVGGNSPLETVAVPSTANTGTFYYGACIVLDKFHCNSVGLAVTENPAPDLEPAIAVPVFDKSSYAVSETITIHAKVRNSGRTASADGQIRFFREAGKIDSRADDVQVGATVPFSAIAAGETSAALASTFVATRFGDINKQQFYFTIDMTGDEANMINNSSDLGYLVVFAPVSEEEKLDPVVAAAADDPRDRVCPTLDETLSTSVSSIDTDGDKLIEIHNLDMLNNMRHSPYGTAYKTSAADSGTRCGAGGNTNCAGYELMANLDFAAGASYQDGTVNSAWRPNTENPATATNAGWVPIGNGIDSFQAIFAGNSHTISNLYVRNTATSRSGLFGTFGSNEGAVGVQTGSTCGAMSNLVLVNANVYGKGSVGAVIGELWPYTHGIYNIVVRGGSVHGSGLVNENVGGLVGWNSDLIAASSSSANVYSGRNNIQDGYSGDYLGGLIGRNTPYANIFSYGYPTVIASFATGTVSAKGGYNRVGGFIGFGNYANGFATATRAADSGVFTSYATGSTYGGTYAFNNVGGFVGEWDAGGYGSSPISASYATGNVDPGSYSASAVGQFSGKMRGIHASWGLTANYGFGVVVRYDRSYDPEGFYNSGSIMPAGMINASQLTIASSSNVEGIKWNRNVQNWDWTSVVGSVAQVKAQGWNWNSIQGKPWVFDDTYAGPALKYTDYDGPGQGIDYCAIFPVGACGSERLLPNQPVVDLGNSISTAYVVDAEVSSTSGVVSLPVKITTGDSDYFRILVVEAGTLVIESLSALDVNPQVTFRLNGGAVVESDNDDGDGDNFRMSRAVPRGIYYVEAQGHGGTTGSYILNVRMTK